MALFSDNVDKYVPLWLRQRPGLDVGYKVIWTMAAAGDAMVDAIQQAVTASWPGRGTETALPRIGRSRGLLRWQDEPADEYASRLRDWLNTWRNSVGTEEFLAYYLHGYLRTKPVVRIVNRHGRWTTVASDGTVSVTEGVPFDWDSVSNPERHQPGAPWWSDLFIVVYTKASQWPGAGAWGDGGKWGDALGFGHGCTAAEYNEVRSFLRSYKPTHSRIRAVIWIPEDYGGTGQGLSWCNPANPSGMATFPAGTAGSWIAADGSPSRPSWMRFWEP